MMMIMMLLLVRYENRMRAELSELLMMLLLVLVAEIVIDRRISKVDDTAGVHGY